MQIIVVADEAGRKEFEEKTISAEAGKIFVEDLSELKNNKADAVFLLKDISITDHTIFGETPVFISAVINTLKELELPANIHRINGWPGFIKRETWEIATTDDSAVKNIFEKLGWKYVNVADEPGLVAARIIAMIINEAYFALGENVSTKEEIDLAMKLGTNYPYGPFEWSAMIGLQNIYDLLEKLSKTDSRYNIAPALKKEVNN